MNAAQDQTQRDRELKGMASGALLLRFSAVLLALFFWLTVSSRAEEPSATAMLSSAMTTLGEPVELQITVQGAENVQPPKIAVDGLTAQYNGTSTQVQIINFKMTRSIALTYTLMPTRTGQFTIPALQIDAGGKSVSTRPLTLTVSSQASGNPQGAAQPGPGEDANAPQEGDRLAFAEWVIPNTSAYVGEAIPTELRLYLAVNTRWDLQNMPTLTGDGFTVGKITKPERTTKVTKNGRPYDLAIFKTSVTPVKSGKLTLPAAEINTVATSRAKRSRRPQLPPGFPNAFDDSLFDNFFQTQQQVVIRPDPVELEIKPLPVAGKPKSFSGAIGRFTLSSKASPLRVRAGDPITVTAEVSGIGNFDRINAPVLAEEPGWKSYPPSSKFQPNDEVGISGVKVFEMAVMAESAKTALPKLEFSYFDPAQASYVTLTDGPLAVTVEGSVAPAATPALPAAPIAPGATPAATPKPNDIQFIRIDPGTWGVTLEPAWQTRTFWLAQLVPLLSLLAAGGWLWRQARAGDLRARRIAALNHNKAEALRTVHREEATAETFYDAAMQVIQLETALATGADPATVDAEMACASRPLDPQTAAALRALFATHDELRYAGAGVGSGDASLPPERRESVQQLLEEFEKRHA